MRGFAVRSRRVSPHPAPAGAAIVANRPDTDTDTAADVFAVDIRRQVTLGDTGYQVFPLMIGSAEFGWNLSQQESYRLLDHYFDYGGNALHTSDGYAGGRSEHIVGSWLRRSRTRDRAIVSARVGSHPDNLGLGAVNLVRGVEGALDRLNTDRIDLLYLDESRDTGTHLEDILATVEWLRDSGKIAAVGAYGFSAEKLVEARILAAAGYPRISVVDEPYNLLRRRSFEGNLRLVAGAQGLASTPSHALEHGFLSGRARSKSVAGPGVRGEQLRRHLNRRGIRVLRALDEVSEQVQASVAAVSLAWLLAQRTIVAPIVNPVEPEHIDQMVRATEIELSSDQLSQLSGASESR